jgi:hypothetical protein
MKVSLRCPDGSKSMTIGEFRPFEEQSVSVICDFSFVTGKIEKAEFQFFLLGVAELICAPSNGILFFLNNDLETA